MNFFVILTPECNLQCSYCYGKIWEDGSDEVCQADVDCFLPLKIGYDIGKLAAFCRKDPDCGLLLYGGEPLLEMETLKKMMDSVPAKRFILQTNGLLLDTLPRKYLGMLDGLQVSIDGDEKTTDGYRGAGTYKKAVANARAARQHFRGEMIARMTVAENTDIRHSVNHLLGLGIFDAVHWQLDAGFGPDYGKRNFSDWARKSYNPGITMLTDEWVGSLRKGKVPMLYPFLGIMQSLLDGKKSSLRCGAGYAHYAIQTDGNIVPCPVMAGMKKFYAGSLSSNPSKLRKFRVGEPCASCEVKGVCGGRCLFANTHMFWGQEGFAEVCGTVRHLITEMQRVKPEVEQLIEDGVISPDSMGYTKFNSCEIIP